MSRSNLAPCSLVLTILLCACVASGTELVVNGAFDSDTSGWRVVGRGSLAHSTDGVAAAGSLQGAGGLAGDATHVIAGQCLRVSARL